MPEKIITTRPWTQHPLSPGKLYRQQRADIKTPVINTYAKQVRLIISVRNEYVFVVLFFYLYKFVFCTLAQWDKLLY